MTHLRQRASRALQRIARTLARQRAHHEVTTPPEETREYWLPQSHPYLADIAATMHRQRRLQHEQQYADEVNLVRRTIAELFARGSGLEVGAGSRPFPLPATAKCFYGDKRDQAELARYFGGPEKIPPGSRIDAQSLAGIPSDSLDFLISAHVIEHLEDPIGSIKQSLRVLKSGGVLILVVPDRRYTFDKDRPPTTLEHLIQDETDGGISTRSQAYEEHIRYIHTQWNTPIPEGEIPAEIIRLTEAMFDTHFHCWSGDEFVEVINHCLSDSPSSLIGRTFIHNENIFVLRKSA